MKLFGKKEKNKCVCGTIADKLSTHGLCPMCEWAISQAPVYSERIKELDRQIAEKSAALRQMEADLEAMRLSRRIVLEDNVVIRAALAKAYRKIKKLEAVSADNSEG